MALSYLKGKSCDQCRLFTFIEAELACGLVDEFELPGDQGQAVFKRTQCLVVQAHVILSVVEQFMDVQREFRHSGQCQCISPVGQL